MSSTHDFHTISDDDLLRRLAEILKQSRRVEVDLIAHIGEVDARRLYAREACSSMQVYCTEVLHLSDAEAYLRIGAARASRKYPAVLAMLRDGRIHLSGIGKLAAHLTDANCDEVLGSRRSQVQAPDRGARRRAGAQAGCSGYCAQAPRARRVRSVRPTASGRS